MHIEILPDFDAMYSLTDPVRACAEITKHVRQKLGTDFPEVILTDGVIKDLREFERFLLSDVLDDYKLRTVVRKIIDATDDLFTDLTTHVETHKSELEAVQEFHEDTEYEETPSLTEQIVAIRSQAQAVPGLRETVEDQIARWREVDRANWNLQRMTILSIHFTLELLRKSLIVLRRMTESRLRLLRLIQSAVRLAPLLLPAGGIAFALLEHFVLEKGSSRKELAETLWVVFLASAATVLLDRMLDNWLEGKVLSFVVWLSRSAGARCRDSFLRLATAKALARYLKSKFDPIIQRNATRAPANGENGSVPSLKA